MSPDSLAQALAALQYADSQFPGGAFAFSWGLEGLMADGLVKRETFETFLRDQICHRWLSFDRYFVESAAESFRAAEELAALDDLVDAWTPVELQRSGSSRSGKALLGVHVRLGSAEAIGYHAYAQAKGCPCHAPVITGLVLAAKGLDRQLATAVAVHGVMMSSVTSAIRLGLIGHLDASRAIEKLRPEIVAALEKPGPKAADLHSFTPLPEIAMMRHSSRELRLFSN